MMENPLQGETNPDEPPQRRGSEVLARFFAERMPVMPNRARATGSVSQLGVRTRLSLHAVTRPSAVFDERHRHEAAELLGNATSEFRCLPGTTMTMEQFVNRGRAERSLYPDDWLIVQYAVDGLVVGESCEVAEPGTLYISSDHHSPHDPPDTPSSCIQVARTLQSRRFLDARKGYRKVHIVLSADDADQDVVACRELVRNGAEIFGGDDGERAAFEEFLLLQDMMDRRCGLVPIDPSCTLPRRMAWVFEPYMAARNANRLHAKDPKDPASVRETALELAGIVDTCADRMTLLRRGAPGEIGMETHCEWICRGSTDRMGWGMVDEVASGDYHRIAVAHEPSRRMHVTMRHIGPSRFAYALTRIGDADLLSIFARLNEIDPPDPAAHRADELPDRWGGNGDRGGSPRRSGTSIPPDEFVLLVNRFLRERS